jgi:signal transduction histidine kinase
LIGTPYQSNPVFRQDHAGYTELLLVLRLLTHQDVREGAGGVMARATSKPKSAKPKSARARSTAVKPRRPPSAARANEIALAAFAHDIRTALTGILALGELLASSNLGERERRWAAGMNFHLRKPVSPSALSEAIGAVVAPT